MLTLFYQKYFQIDPRGVDLILLGIFDFGTANPLPVKFKNDFLYYVYYQARTKCAEEK